MGPHQKFLELCAVSTSGELTEQERNKLEVHLAQCAECREALKQFEAVADRGISALASQLDDKSAGPSVSLPNEAAEAKLLERLAKEEKSGSAHHAPHSNDQASFFRSRVRRAEFWFPFAAGILLLLSLGVVILRSGSRNAKPLQAERGMGSAENPQPSDVPANSATADSSSAGLLERDKVIAGLQHQVELQLRETVRLKAQLKDLQTSAQTSEEEKNRVAQERDFVAQKLQAEEATLNRTQTELEARQQRDLNDSAHAAALEARVADLSHLLDQREKTIDRTEVLLERDRDLRELMGARDLYVAEVYDLARTGETQKPCGRVFLTKGKSLIFYAFDLDQQRGLKEGSSFQAWGGRGPDREQALNLGIFFEDNVSKKRWVVKSEDPKTLAEIDAVFVTVEPKGGSVKPSGRPVLYAYLKVDSNHP